MALDAKQALQLIANAAQRSVSSMFGGVFNIDTKHANYYNSYGYPEELTFDQMYTRFKRDPLANAVCKRHIQKCWQDYPHLTETDDVDAESQVEEELRQKLEDLRFWPKLAETDLRSRVGEYSAVILRLADDKRMNQPVDTVPGGLDGLVEIIPAWQGQLQPSLWDTDDSSQTYGQPLMYNFNEAAVDPETGKTRTFEVHPDRVVIWSRDGSVYGESALEPVFNSLIDAEKVRGSGGEGFYQAAKGTPHYKVDKEANLQQLAQMLGVDNVADIQEAMGDISDGARKDFDKAVVTQGIETDYMTYSVPDAEKPFNIAVQSVSAGSGIPAKILTGSQSGERASTEDANEWNQTCQSRRTNYAKPNIMAIVNRLVRFRILPERDWTIQWSDLTESTKSDKVELSEKLANVNKNSVGTGQVAPFSAEEIRQAAGYKPEIE